MGLALEEPGENETLHKIDGIDFSISDSILPYTIRKEIDYVTRYGKAGFQIAPAFGAGC